MVNPEAHGTPEIQTDRVISFRGDDLVALEVYLRDARYEGRSGSAYFRLVDMHNSVREILGMDAMPVHPGFQDGYEKYKAQHATQA